MMLFENMDLQSTWDSHSKGLKSFKDRLNSMSKDIKTLENVIGNLGFCQLISYECPDIIIKNTVHKCYITWSRVLRNEDGPFRLCVGMAPDPASVTCVDEVLIPLIESKIEVREHVFPHLKDFLKQCATLGGVES